jgi:transcriptional regulator PpsR
MDGIIREAAFANSVSDEGVDGLVGQPWIATVDPAGGSPILQIMAEARANGASNFQQVNQRFPSGLELPIEYNAVRLGARSGLIAIGKNLQAIAGVHSKVIAAQQTREQDAWKLRSVETRFRLLLEESEDPVLVLRTNDLQILDANSAAIHAGAFDAGRDFTAAVAPQNRASFHAMMTRVSEQGRAPGILVNFGASSTPWLVRASLATTDGAAVFLLQLVAVTPFQTLRRDIADQDALIARSPDAFVVIDAGGAVEQANRAFLDLVQIPLPGGVIGEPIARWLTLPGADASVLIANVIRHGIVRNFSTVVQGELGIEAQVEISAVGDLEDGPHHILLTVRDVSRRITGVAQRPVVAQEPDGCLLASIARVTEQIGRVPLPDLMRETGILIERHCIDDALKRFNGNRTAAAELLGVSRQSLYVKLSRHNMGSRGEEIAPED